eukprot:scaffold438_cov110-Isochrysis_galbana.AAC.8
MSPASARHERTELGQRPRLGRHSIRELILPASLLLPSSLRPLSLRDPAQPGVRHPEPTSHTSARRLSLLSLRPSRTPIPLGRVLLLRLALRGPQAHAGRPTWPDFLIGSHPH